MLKVNYEIHKVWADRNRASHKAGYIEIAGGLWNEDAHNKAIAIYHIGDAHDVNDDQITISKVEFV